MGKLCSVQASSSLGRRPPGGRLGSARAAPSRSERRLGRSPCPLESPAAGRELAGSRREKSGSRWGSPRRGSPEKVREESREARERARKEAEQLRGSGRVWELCRAGGRKGKR